jgi:hypothetical protein
MKSMNVAAAQGTATATMPRPARVTPSQMSRDFSRDASP